MIGRSYVCWCFHLLRKQPSSATAWSGDTKVYFTCCDCLSFVRRTLAFISRPTTRKKQTKHDQTNFTLDADDNCHVYRFDIPFCTFGYVYINLQHWLLQSLAPFFFVFSCWRVYGLDENNDVQTCLKHTSWTPNLQSDEQKITPRQTRSIHFLFKTQLYSQYCPTETVCPWF